MESVACRAYLYPTPLPLLTRLRAVAAPKPYPHKPLFSLRASSQTPTPILSSPLKTAAASLAAAAALLLVRLHRPSPSLAAAPNTQSSTLPSSSDSLTDADKESLLEEFLASCPDDTRSLRALMELKIKSGKLPDAISIVDRLIPLEPAENDLPVLKAHLQTYAGDTEAARQGFEALLADNPLLVEAYHGLVMAASQSGGELASILERVEVAMESCRRAKRKEDLRDFKLLLAQIRVIQGKYEEALKVYQDLVKEEPRDFRPYLCQGIIYTLLRKKGEAEKQFQKYRRLVPKGHPYAQYFDDNMVAMKVFSQMEENKRKNTMKA